MTEHRPPHHPARDRGLGNWVWVVFGVAMLTLAGAVLIAVSALLGDSEPSKTPSSPSSSASVTASQPVPAQVTLPPAVPHVDEGVFLRPAYADGARKLSVTAELSVSMVGASADSSVVAVVVESEVRGIDAATAQVVWTYPSYACSHGSWHGVALCVDAVDASQAETADVVGLDLATGTTTFNFTLDQVPRFMAFIGTDDNHAYFEVSKTPEAGHSVLALTMTGDVAWVAPLDQEVFGAALVADNKIAVNLVDSVVVLDRATGDVTFQQPVPDQLVTLLWDGWTVYELESEKPHKVFDLSGTLIDEYEFIDEFIPESNVGDLPTPVYERSALDGGIRTARYAWGVTRDGERVVTFGVNGIVDPENKTLVNGGFLLGLSGDGSLLLSDIGKGTIHDARSGAIIGGVEKEGGPGGIGIVDGIVYYTYIGEVVLLLPGAAG